MNTQQLLVQNNPSLLLTTLLPVLTHPKLQVGHRQLLAAFGA